MPPASRACHEYAETRRRLGGKGNSGGENTLLACAVGLFVLINRDILEDSLGRALSANELAAVDAAGSHVAITST